MSQLKRKALDFDTPYDRMVTKFKKIKTGCNKNVTLTVRIAY